MAYEEIFNVELAKRLAKNDDPESFLNNEMKKIHERVLQLNNSRQKMAAGYQMILEGLAEAFPNLDLNDPNLIGTPDRMARAQIEVCSGLGTNDKEIFSTTFPSGNYDEMVMLKDIEYTSICAHHFFPFMGHAHIGYLPLDKGQGSKVCGVSKLARIVDAYAKRPQLQERLCIEIMEAIKNEITPAGVMVVVEGKHGCIGCRGVKKSTSSMITSAVDGTFKTSTKLRTEFLDLLRLRAK